MPAQVLSALKRLKLLDIQGTLVEDVGAAAIASLQDLEVLNTRRARARPLRRRIHMTGMRVDCWWYTGIALITCKA